MPRDRKHKGASKNKEIAEQPKQSGPLEQPPMYQHFIPRFILRNFAHPYSSLEHGPKEPKTPQKAKYQKRNPRPGDLLVHHIDLTADPPRVTESSIKRILGQTDMYRDTSQPAPSQQNVEAMLSRLESRASTVIRRITKAFDAEESAVWLPRDELSALRKFLFLLKYRGSSFHRRFYHVDAADYAEPDSPLLQDYMKKKGIKRPVDVWLKNLKAIMDLKMDPNGHWVSELMENMYEEDAAWFVTHVLYMYMAICTPAAGSDHEFLLTDHCYDVYDGPAALVHDRESGEPRTASHASLHDLAPVTPKLMLVLRHYVFPLPEEDADPTVARERADFRKLAVEDPFGPDAITQSRLADLPITKARNSYSNLINGRFCQRPEWNGQRTLQDSFCFEFFPINDRHIDAMNGIILDNSWMSSTIIFTSQSSLARTLEVYLDITSHDGKCVTGHNGNARLSTLQKLSAVSRELGSTKEPHWADVKADSIVDFSELAGMQVDAHRLVLNWIQTPLEEQGNFMQCYTILGGFPLRLIPDLQQAILMWQLRVRIDKWSVGLNEVTRERNRQLLTATYLRCPPRRVWLYMKFVKAFLMSNADGATLEQVLASTIREEGSSSEDIIAKARSLIPRYEDLNKLIYQTAMNEGDMSAFQITGLWVERKPTEDEEFRSAMIRKIAWFTPGSIINCGIPEIENFAMQVKVYLVMGDTLTLDELARMETHTVFLIECLTRKCVQCNLAELLGDKMDSSTLNDFEKVFFELTYPTLVMPADGTE